MMEENKFLRIYGEGTAMHRELAQLVDDEQPMSINGYSVFLTQRNPVLESVPIGHRAREIRERLLRISRDFGTFRFHQEQDQD